MGRRGPRAATPACGRDLRRAGARTRHGAPGRGTGGTVVVCRTSGVVDGVRPRRAGCQRAPPDGTSGPRRQNETDRDVENVLYSGVNVAPWRATVAVWMPVLDVIVPVNVWQTPGLTLRNALPVPAVSVTEELG